MRADGSDERVIPDGDVEMTIRYVRDLINDVLPALPEPRSQRAA